MDAWKAAFRSAPRSLPDPANCSAGATIAACSKAIPVSTAKPTPFDGRAARRSYRNLIMVTTLAPCWYCSGLVRQFRIGTLVVGESRTFAGGLDWLRENGVEVIDLDSRECRELLEGFIAEHPEIWNEDIGEE